MRLKTYSAGNMAAALAMVKHDLGPNAAILHTRTYKKGGFLGIGCQSVVEITAADQQQLTKTKKRKTSAKTNLVPLSSLPKAQKTNEQNQKAGDLIRRTYFAAKAELANQPRETPSISIAQTSNVAVADPPKTQQVIHEHQTKPDQLTEEVKSVKQMVEKMLRQVRQPTSTPNLPEKLVDQYQTLIEQEVSQELADEVIHQVSRQIDDQQCNSDKAVQSAMRSVLAKLIPTDNSTGLFETNNDGRPRTIALVGPTGVGKTTTVAKLAATFKLKQQKSVGLITLDTYRIAAVDQLRTYANIIGLPLRVVTSKKEMMDALTSFSNCDVVIIDTIGRSQKDGRSLKALADLVKASQPDEVHLVLSSTCAQSVLMDTIEQFTPVGPDRIIFTKLDEAVSLGVLLNVARKVNKRLSYITTGQEVPHKIEASEPQRIAELVLEGGLR